MGFFDKVLDVFEDIGEDIGDVLTFGGISKKKTAKRNARALERNAFLNSEALRFDAETVLSIAQKNRILALKDADAIKKIGDLNADAFESDAEAAIIAAEEQARNFGIVQGRKIGSQRATFAASGVRIEGSPLIVLSESLRIGKRNIRNIIKSGEIMAGRSLSKANITRTEASLRMRRFMDQADIILETGIAESERLRTRADIVLETGQAAAEVALLQGRSALIGGITQGITTGIRLGFAFA